MEEEHWRSATVFDNFKFENAHFISSWVATAGDSTRAIAHLS